MRTIIILAVLVSAIFTSCTSGHSSGEYHKTRPTKARRCHPAYYSSILSTGGDGKWHALDNVMIRDCDTLLKNGDIVITDKDEGYIICDSCKAGGAQ